MADARTETKTFKSDVLRAKKKAFLRRKECIKKKTKELSVLCDVKACAVILGPDGQIDSWPENCSDVREVINLYQNGSLNKKRKQQYDDRGCNKKQVLGGDEGAQNRALNLEEFLKKLEAKLDEVKKRIQFVKSKDQEIESGCSFVKYDTSEEADKLGNPLGIPPNAWPPKNSQNLGSHSNVGVIGFGNRLPVDIVSSPPGYIGGFSVNVDGVHFGTLGSCEPMSQLGFQSGQYLPSSLQPQPSNAAYFSTTQSLHMPYYAGHTPYSQAPSWFETESTLVTGGEQSQQNYIDNSDDSSWMQLPLFQETTSFNPTMETPCCCDFQLDEVHGFEPAGQISLSFDHCITGVELPATENDSFSAGVELTSNQVDTFSTVLDSELELPPTEYSPPNSCCSDTIMPMGEEDDLDVLLQQFQRTAPTIDSFNPDCGLMDMLDFPSEVGVH